MPTEPTQSPRARGESQKRIVVLTGAGVSADSGLSTFRGAGGLWEKHRFEELASPVAWANDPGLVWRFYQMRRAQLLEVEPNAAHAALLRLQRGLEAAGHEFVLVSQNVDNLHQRAGSTPLAMHGQLAQLRCESCHGLLEDLSHLDEHAFVPCPDCGSARLRPHIVWFGEMPMHLEEIGQALRTCTHFVSIGTSGVVYPAAGFLAQARQVGAKTWVNSLDEPENLDPADLFVPGPAALVIPEQVERWLEDWTKTPTRDRS